MHSFLNIIYLFSLYFKEIQSKDVYIKLGQSLEICVHNPDEDAKDKDDPDETHDEIAMKLWNWIPAAEMLDLKH